ncbi:acyltransferase family protein [Cohnella terricola]|uniref:Acyltransferase family protein n=1 Tax=Cohnella terricola TaxID=1289167 RepID=A0A559JMK3_9BACL|nr:acyltransferase family protein [Cohnella terricola]TVY01114.1 acyltransferase family protein [Cohnella terricola]
MENKLIKEVNSIRAIACLCVVFLHAIQVRLFTWDTNEMLHTVLGLLAFGTPTFVFLSELILSRSYPNRLPNNFFKKRVIPILVPFICISFFYALVQDINDIPHLLRDFTFNLLGNYRGPWFILVIFQFYVLHRIFVKYLSRVSPTIVLTGSFIINLAYLAIFNLIQPPSETGFIAFLWEFGYWVPCIGWLFYFSLAYYCGKNYERFIRKLKKHPYLVLSAPIIGLALILYVNSFHIMPYGSKRMDMVIFTTTMILALFLLMSQLKKQPAFLEFVSKYTFGIFLIHLFFIRVAKKMIELLGFNLGYFEIPILFLSALTSSIIAVHVLNRFPQGKYLIGSIKHAKTPDSIRSSDIRSPAV